MHVAIYLKEHTHHRIHYILQRIHSEKYTAASSEREVQLPLHSEKYSCLNLGLKGLKETVLDIISGIQLTTTAAGVEKTAAVVESLLCSH